MRKLFISCSALTAGGAERVLSILSKPFADHYDEVQYIMWYDKPIFYKIDERVKIVSVKQMAKGKGYISMMKTFRHYIKDNMPDIILSFSAPFNMLALSSLLGTKNKLIAAERVDPKIVPFGKPFEIVRNILYYNAVSILTQTKSCRDYFTGKLREKAHIIYNPVVLTQDYVGQGIKHSKEKVIISAGRLMPQKNHKMLISAFSKFVKIHPEYKLIIYGEGALRNELEKQILQLDLQGRVLLPGTISNLWEKLFTADMFIMTSNYEGMSNSLIEAMCLGIPCISTKVSGAIDLIKNDLNGILIDVNDEDALITAMNRIADNPTYAFEIASQAVKLYDLLNIDKISDQWIEYIDSIIKIVHE